MLDRSGIVWYAFRMKSHPIKYFLYARRSMDEKDRQVLSLDSQTNEWRTLAKRERISIYEVLEESQTAKEPGRAIFNDMLDRIERGEANGILCWDIDRLYRNPVDEGRVRWMLQRGVIGCIRTPTRQFFPEDAGLLMGVEGGRATDYIIRLRKNVMRGVREKLRRGEWPGAKPIGYIYDHDKRNIVPDPKEAKIVELVFGEFATGTRSLLWTSDRLAQFGILTRSGKQWTKSLVRKFLTNKLYIGIMVWSGETFEGKYKPIVPLETFEKVQKALKVRSKPRRVRNGHNFPFCGLFRCTCGSMVSAQWAKGNGGTYRYYRCTKKSGVCHEPYTQEHSVISQCLEALKRLAIDPEQAAAIRSMIDEKTEKDGQYLEARARELGEKLGAIQGKLNMLTRGYVDEVIDRESYEASKADLVLEKTTLKREKERLARTGSTYWNEPANDFVNALELAGKVQTDGTPQEISALVQKVGTNRLITSKQVSFGFSPEYEFAASLLSEINVALSADPSLRSNVDWQSSNWCPLVNYLQTVFDRKT
jgi:site-specific DNA recombinase